MLLLGRDARVASESVGGNSVMVSTEWERQVVTRAHHDPTAFAQLYDAYFPRLYAYVRARVSSTADAEDLAA